MQADPTDHPAVLLVDDEEGIRKVLSITLADMGHQVHTAADGEQALEVLGRERPPVVLTDVKMPGMDGLELLSRIKEDYPDTEVIMVTGHGDMDMAVESLQRDATDFITKPIRHDALEVALRRSAERIAMREELRAHTERLEQLVEEKSAALVAAERRLAAMQAAGEAVRGLTEAMSDLSGQMDAGPALMADLPCFVSVHDRDLAVVSVNGYFRERLGDGRGRRSWELFAGRREGDGDCPVAATFRTGEGRRSRERILDAQGRAVPVIVHTSPLCVAPQPDGGDGPGLVLSIAADIGEVQRLQEELKQSQLRYQHLFDQVPCYATVLDRDMLFLEVNRRFVDDFGARVGQTCYGTYMHREIPCTDCPALKTFEDGQLHEAEKVVTTRDGRTRHVWIQTVPILEDENGQETGNGHGRVEQVMELSTDITQIRELQDRLTSLGLLIGSVSHGVKGLLTALDGGIYRVDSGLKKGDDGQVQAGWDTVRSMVERIRGMVLDILYYAKRRELATEAVDAAALGAQAAATAEPRADRQGVRLVRAFADGPLEFQADAGALQAALVNLLENAVDACSQARAPEGGHEVRFTVLAATDVPPGGENGDAVSHTGEPPPAEGGVVFEVSDTGVGMDRETREKLFTLFFSSKGSKGTGLGLFISGETVRQHGGSIEVASEPGRGARFTVRLPAVPPGS